MIDAIIGFTVDFSLLQHLVINHLAPFFIVFGVSERIIISRTIGNGRQAHTFFQRQLRKRFGKVNLCGGFDAATSLRHGNHVQIQLQNFLFFHALF